MKFIRSWAALLALACFSLVQAASAQDVGVNIVVTPTWTDLVATYSSLASVNVAVQNKSNPAANTPVLVNCSSSGTAPTGGGVLIYPPDIWICNTAHIWVESINVNGIVSAAISNTSGGGSGGNAAASATGSAVPSSAGYTGINVSGNLVGVSSSNPMPVSGTFYQATQPVSGTVTSSPASTTPIALVTATAFNALGYGSVTISCTVAPSAGTVVGSPDNSADYVTLTAVLNNSAGYSTTTTVSATGLYSVPGHQYIEVTGLTGGTCFIAGGQ